MRSIKIISSAIGIIGQSRINQRRPFHRRLSEGRNDELPRSMEHSVRGNGSVKDSLLAKLPVLLPLGLTYRGLSSGEKVTLDFTYAHGQPTKTLRKRNYWEI